MLGLAAALILLAILGKVASGLAVWGRGLNRWGIGVGMIPRGEVGLIFAQIGLAAGVIAVPLYTAVVGMVVATTFIAPILLKRVLRDKEVAPPQ
jgi:Kef-type K+ transport system membrane component KefB